MAFHHRWRSTLLRATSLILVLCSSSTSRPLVPLFSSRAYARNAFNLLSSGFFHCSPHLVHLFSRHIADAISGCFQTEFQKIYTIVPTNLNQIETSRASHCEVRLGHDAYDTWGMSPLNLLPVLSRPPEYYPNSRGHKFLCQTRRIESSSVSFTTSLFSPPTTVVSLDLLSRLLVSYSLIVSLPSGYSEVATDS